MRTPEQYWSYVYTRMKKDETNSLVYRKWFEAGGINALKKDVVSSPTRTHILGKIELMEPFSPTNYKWILRPPIVPKRQKQRLEYNCITLTMEIEKGSDLSKSGIYKIVFDNGCFYIGSTSNFRKRVGCMIGSFRGYHKIHNKKMLQCVAECDRVYFQIIKYTDDQDSLKQVETETIAPFIGSNLLINRAHDANSNRGIKWTKEEKIKVKQTLIDKYKNGILKPNAYKYRKCSHSDSKLFNSKCFGDK